MFSHKFLHAFSKITLRFLTGIDAPSNKLPRTFLHVRTYRKRGTEGGRKKVPHFASKSTEVLKGKFRTFQREVPHFSTGAANVRYGSRP